jgi:hypothetical protein
LLALLALIVMPLDGVKHARAEHDKFEDNEDDRDPVHDFVFPG